MTRNRTHAEWSQTYHKFSQTFDVDTSKLAPETRRVWEYISSQSALAGFVLIGGTALTMHIGHRISEDLDFITVEKRLPRAALDALVMRLKGDGFNVERNDDPLAYEEFLIAGEDLHDHQQDLLVDGIKVSFIAPYPDWASAVDSSKTSLVRVATLPELFRLKALAASSRHLSRDSLDLYFLFKEHGFTLTDFHQAFHRPDVHHPERAISKAFQNLCLSVKSAKDPGYETLLEDAPSIEGIAKFFSALRDEYQVEQARLAFQTQNQRAD